MTWNCTGGVQTSVTDENGQVSSATYASDTAFWASGLHNRPARKSEDLLLLSQLTYPTINDFAWFLTFNNGNSQTSDLRYSDSLGRVYVDQHEESPSSSTLDSVSYAYDSNGRLYSTSVPCAVGYGAICSTPKTTQTYDALNRSLTTTDGGNGTVTNTYTQNDVLVVQGPPPTGENAKSRQLEYDGLGRLTSVCEITTASGSGACGQKAARTGFLTKYTYDTVNNLTNVTQNAQSTSQQPAAIRLTP